MDDNLAENLARELAMIKSRIEQLEARADEVKAKMRALAKLDEQHPNAEIKTPSGLTIGLALNRRIDVRRVMATYPVHEYPHFYKAVPNTTVIKAEIGQNAYDRLMAVSGEAKVTLR